MKQAILLLTCISILFLSGCASVMRGDTQHISISSEPTGAEIYISGPNYNWHKLDSKTPSYVILKRKYPHIITLKKKGYFDHTTQLNPIMDAAIVGNFIAGGLIGGAIDVSSGAAYTLNPSAIIVNLQRDYTIAISDSIIFSNKNTYNDNIQHQYKPLNKYTIRTISGVFKNVYLSKSDTPNQINYKRQVTSISEPINIEEILNIYYKDIDITNKVIDIDLHTQRPYFFIY